SIKPPCGGFLPDKMSFWLSATIPRPIGKARSAWDSPYALVGPDPDAHFQILAEMMRSRRPMQRTGTPGPATVCAGQNFLGEPDFGCLQAPKSNPNRGG